MPASNLNSAPASALYLILCLAVSVVRDSQGISIGKLAEYSKFNLTKRPLNLYITANGKHAIINNRTLDLAQIGDGVTANSGHTVKTIAQKTSEFIDYRLAQPPFSIKKRGSIILLHNATGNSLSWHQGYPSLMQMLAASGHTTVSIEMAKDTAKNAKRIRQLISAEKLHNITLIGSDESGEEIILDLLKGIRELPDGVILISAPKFEQKWKNIVKSTELNTNTSMAIIFVRFVEGKFNETSPANELTANSAVKVVNLEKNTEIKQVANNGAKSGKVAEEEHSKRLMQVFSNYLDFIHPR